MISRKGTHAGHFLYYEELASEVPSALAAHTIPVHRSLPRPLLNTIYPANPKSLADHLRTARLDLHLKVEQVAMLTGFSQGAVMAWGTDRRKPTADSVRRVSEFYGSRS